MHYSLFIIIFLSTMIGQTIVGSRIGSDPFTGSSRSTAMGNTHLLNSSFSYSARYNAARIPSISQNKYNFSIQLNRYGVFERRSLIMKDFFGDFLTYGDYVSNEYSFYQISGGLASSISIDELKLGFGLNHAPLTHFKYKYLEEVRGNYSLDDGEYGSKDPIVGYHTLEIDGTIMMSSLGLGIQTGPISFGVSVNQVHPSNRKGYLGVDSLYEDVSNLSTYPDINTNAKTSKTNFLSFSTQCILNPNLIIAASFEEMTRINIDSSLVDVENNYAYYNLKGYDSYIKPSMESLAISFISKNKCLLNKKIFSEEAGEIIFKFFSDILSLVSGSYYPPRSKKVVNLINRLRKNRFSKSTLGGCVIEEKTDFILISKELNVRKTTQELRKRQYYHN